MQSEQLEQLQHSLQDELTAARKQSTSFSYLRLLCMIMVLAFCWIAYQNAIPVVYLLAFIGACGFLFLVKKHMALQAKIEYQVALSETYDDVAARKHHGWKQFNDDGHDILDESMTQAYDMDLLGKASLFQYLSVAKTPQGRRILASLLTWQCQQDRDIVARQQAVKECSENTAFVMHMSALSKLFEKHGKKRRRQTYEHVYEAMKDTTSSYPFFLHLLSYGLPALIIISVVGMLWFQWNYAVTLICFTLNFVIALILAIRSSAMLAPVIALSDVARDYERMLTAIIKEPMSAPYLQTLKQQIQHADKGIRSLYRITEAVRMRNSFLLNLLGNGFCLLDIHCVEAFARWKKQYGNHLEQWLEQVGKMEAIASLCQISLAKDVCVMPTIKTSTTPQIQADEVYHPLITETDSIANSFHTDTMTYVVTGSNMSGKTTFLRTIGVNMVLFQAGTHVCAKQFCASPMHIFTSMRVHDNVSEGISTFYAEIMRIRDMMQFSKQRQPMLVLVDEIFKGTNSADRIQCAKQAIVKLHQPWVITMVSTHDFELCDLADDDRIEARNFHFSEYYEGDKICFDYHLKSGRCTTTNAVQLMKLAGFFEE